MSYRILLIDDNVGLLMNIQQGLRGDYRVDVAHNGSHALRKLAQTSYTCVLLDLSLPDMSGLAICLKLRQSGDSTPIIVISGDGEVTQKAQLLDAGADDYITKPVNMVELAARLRKTIRRARSPQALGSQLELYGVKLDSLRHTVERDGTAIILRPKEFALLECLMNNVGHVVTRPTLLQYAWEDNEDVWTNVVDVHIKYLRDKLDYPFDKPFIQTVHGLGYKFDIAKVANTMKGGKDSDRTTTGRTH